MDKSNRILIVGGCGYVGQHLAYKYRDDNWEVLLFDWVCKGNKLADFNIHIGNILDRDEFVALVGKFRPHVVIHLASYGMSGSAMLDQKCYQINVNGAMNTIEACVIGGVQLLIYTSTYNVVFGGQELVNGTEKCDYYPCELHTDAYGPSKSMAERLILEAHGKTHMFLKEKENSPRMPLQTCVIRPAAIYGEDEARHFPRIVNHIDSGIFMFRIGQATVDWVYINNLVDAFSLVVDKVMVRKKPLVPPPSTDHISDTGNNNMDVEVFNASGEDQVAPGGPIYFISDGTPVDNFEFLRPLCCARDAPYPEIVFPVWFMLIIGYISEMIFHIFKKLFGVTIEPFLTRAEVLKVGVTHFFSISRARRELGYNPKVTTQEGSERMAKKYAKDINNSMYFRFAPLIMWVLIGFGMGTLYYYGYSTEPGDATEVLWKQWSQDYKSVPLWRFYFNSSSYKLRAFALFIFQSQENLRILFQLACLTHVIEAAFALYYAISIGCRSTWLIWGIQTLLLGYPSLKFLVNRKALMRRLEVKSK